jgi:hypothetical protein
MIPAMTDPMGAHWPQPCHAAVLVDDTHAVVSTADFLLLREYSGTLPSGVYPGKMWRRHNGIHDPQCSVPVWLLCWYGDSPHPNRCSINSRILLVA